MRKTILTALGLLLLSGTAAWSQTYVISTFAGFGAFGFFVHPGFNGVAVDGSGNVYIAESGTNAIRQVSPGGIINTVAGVGNGTPGFSGDGGPASTAQLNYPSGVAVDTSGSLYIADTGNNRIRKISPSGIISTVTGNGTPGHSGDGGPASTAQLASPSGVAVDNAGNLYISDSGNSRIRKVSTAGTITTVAGNGGIGFSGDGGLATNATLSLFDAYQGLPSGVAVDSVGNLYITDTGNSSIREVSPSGIITTVAGSGLGGSLAHGFSGDGGPATKALLNGPSGVALDSFGNLYIAASYNSRIRKVSVSGIITTVAGGGTDGLGDGGPATNAQLSGPVGVAVDRSGNVYVADTNDIRLLQPVGISVNAVTNAASFSNLPQAAASIASVFGTSFASTLFVASSVPLPTTLAGVSVQLNGVPVPLFAVSPQQINFQIPWGVPGQGQASLTVTVNGVTSSAVTVNLAAYSPALFATNQQGTGQGAIQIANTAIFAAPSGSGPGVQARPASRGEIVTIYCAGLGPVTNQPPTGAPSSANPLSATTTMPSVTIGGIMATVSFSGLAPSYVSLYQVNVQVPANAPTGDAIPVALSIGGLTSNTVTIAVQ